MDIVVDTPRQLATSEGNLYAGVTALEAPTSMVYDSPISDEHVYFASLMFIPHPPASRPAFNSFHEGIDVALGDVHLHINTMGTLCLADPIYSNLGSQPRHQPP
jgi:hypothetical protein